MTENTPETGAGDDWANAMAEQQSAEAATEDAWADALAEAGQADRPQQDTTRPSTSATGSGQATRADDAVFKPLADEARSGTPRELDMIMDIPVTLSVELGQTKLTIRQLLDLAQGSVVELDGLAGEPMSILVNGYLIAQGEVVVVDDKYGIRITEIVTRSERIHKLNK